MNIAVDAYPLMAKTASGIPNYIKSVLVHLAGIEGTDKYFLYSKDRGEFLEKEKNFIGRFGKIGGHASYGNTLWLFSEGIRLMKKDKINLFWGTRQMLPPYMPGGIRRVLTVYDLVPYYFRRPWSFTTVLS